MRNPQSWLMECAAVMAIALANGGVMTSPSYSLLKSNFNFASRKIKFWNF